MEKTKALTLEAGKYYRTRDGRKAFVAGTNPFSQANEMNVAGFVEGDGYMVWTREGSYFTDTESRLDLCAEWVEPKRIQGWVNVTRKSYTNLNSEHLGIIWNTRDLANDYAPDDRIACIEIDVLEGAGLEGAGR